MNNCTFLSAEKVFSFDAFLAKGTRAAHKRVIIMQLQLQCVFRPCVCKLLILIDLDVLRLTINFNCNPWKCLSHSLTQSLTRSQKNGQFFPNCFQTSKVLYQNKCHKNDIVSKVIYHKQNDIVAKKI